MVYRTMIDVPFLICSRGVSHGRSQLPKFLQSRHAINRSIDTRRVLRGPSSCSHLASARCHGNGRGSPTCVRSLQIVQLALSFRPNLTTITITNNHQQSPTSTNKHQQAPTSTNKHPIYPINTFSSSMKV